MASTKETCDGTTNGSGTTATTTTNTSVDGSHVTCDEILGGLHRLSLSLQELDDKTPHALSHYRTLPTTLVEAYDILQQGAALIHGTSTKFTLMEKIPNSEKQTHAMAKDLLKGCELVGTACLVLHERSTGTSTACRQHVKQASRAIVQTVYQLVQTFEGTAQGGGGDRAVALQEENTLGAQRTGAVWQTCNVILEKKLPRGNRNSMRRQLFSYMAECRETMQEFQELIDQGPALVEEDEDAEDENDNQQKAASTKTDGEADKDDVDNDDGWFAFLSGQDQQYTMKEIPIVTAALALIKISRGTVNLTVQACEAVGESLHEDDDSEQTDTKKERNVKLLAWMEQLHRMACVVGDGMTDLGATLYPPLQLSSSSSLLSCELQTQIERQADVAIAPLLDHVLDANTSATAIIDLPENVVELATKLKENLAIRRTEALQAIVTASADN